MDNQKYDILEKKLQNLEELLIKWKEDSIQKNEAFIQRITKLTIKGICIIVATLGAIWSVLELGSWAWNNYKTEQLAQSYSEAADQGYRQSRNPQAALEVINNALEITPDDPDLLYKKFYYETHAALNKLPKLTSFQAKDFEMLNKLSADLVLQKKLTPENNELYVLEALLLKKKQEYPQALTAIENAIKAGVEYPYAESIRIEILLDMQQNDQALASSGKLLKDHPDSKYSHYIHGKVSARKKRYIEAKQSYLKALEFDPTHYDSLYGVALCSSAIIPHDYPTAKEYCQKILSYYPQDQAAYNLLINSCINNSNYALATLYLRRAERLFPKKAMLHLLKSRLYLKQKKFTLAEEACEKAFQLNPEDTARQRQIVTTYMASGKFEKALEYNKFIGDLAIDMNNPLAMNNAAWRFYLIGANYDFAQRLGEIATAKDSSNSYYFGTLAYIYLRKGNFKKALETMDNAIAIAGADRKPVHLVDKALILIKLKDKNTVPELLQQAQKLAPGYYRLHLAAGEYHLLLGDIKKAAAYANSGKKCAVNQSEKTELLMLEAKICAASGKWAEAQKMQKEALENIDNGYSEIRIAYQNYAEYSLANKDLAEAKKVLEVLKSIDSKHPDTVKIENMLKKQQAASL